MVNKNDIIELYRVLSLIRQVELKIVEVYPSDVMQCPVHLSIGQESVATALGAYLGKNDLALGTHRGHALYLAKGGSVQALFAELMGRVDGCSGGYGGSMHLISLESGLLGTSAIVGGSLPIIVGVAMGLKPRNLACVLFGDGACDEGVFYESLNFASLKKLPIVFMCENNRYSVYTHARQRRSVRPYRIAQACDIKSVQVPIEVANDTVALYSLLGDHIDSVRHGKGPLFVECDTVRAYDHNGIRDDVAGGFRPAVEKELFERYCPVKMMKNYLTEETISAIDQENIAKINEAYQTALLSKPLTIGSNYEQLGHYACFT